MSEIVYCWIKSISKAKHYLTRQITSKICTYWNYVFDVICYKCSFSDRILDTDTKYPAKNGTTYYVLERKSSIYSLGLAKDRVSFGFDYFTYWNIDKNEACR